jgi:nitrate/TMAO reductase-like tetraheme cytochrome c subunit
MTLSHRVVVVLVLVVFVAAGMAVAQNKFVGAAKCKACHSVEKMGGLSFKVWEKTPHAKAFATLKTKEADEIAKKKGLKTAAAESPECLKCHVTAADVKKEDGVTCEACHGAASAFLPIHNKPENKEKAIAAGLMLPKKDDAKLCEKCHNEESPTFKGFKLAEAWAKIEHKGKAK